MTDPDVWLFAMYAIGLLGMVMFPVGDERSFS
jgi:hypothetical protein